MAAPTQYTGSGPLGTTIGGVSEPALRVLPRVPPGVLPGVLSGVLPPADAEGPGEVLGVALGVGRTVPEVYSFQNSRLPGNQL